MRRIVAGAMLAFGVALSGLAAPSALASDPSDQERRGWLYKEAKGQGDERPGDDGDATKPLRSKRAAGSFEPEGDDFWVKDRKRDGKSAGILLKVVGGGIKGICRDGDGSKNGWSKCTRRWNIKEGKKVRWTLATCDGDLKNCKRRKGWDRVRGVGWTVNEADGGDV